MCWNDPLIWDDGQIYVPTFTGALFAFILAHPDDGTPEFPERVAQEDANPNAFTEVDIAAANRLRARLPLAGAEALVEQLNAAAGEALGNVARDWELFGAGDGAWAQAVSPGVAALLEAMLAIHGVRFSVATKLLWLKRPDLIPIVDRVVATALLGHEARNVDQVMHCIGRLRQIGLQNLGVIEAALAILVERLPENDAYMGLSAVRALEVVVWFVAQRPHRAECLHVLQAE